jgi:GntR family transcriptional regulator of vanillate catabolism
VSAAAISQGLAATLGLRQLILDGELRAGDRLSELRLAARLGVSRTPLRLALAQLEHEGLLEPLTGGGFALRSFTGQQVADAIDLRGVLEGSAARLAAERVRGYRELGGLVACVAQLDRIIDPRRGVVEDFELYVELNERFHTELIALSRSDALRAAYEHALALPFASPSAFVMIQAEWPDSYPTLLEAQGQHHGLLDAIERGAGDVAEQVAREHARLARSSLDVALNSDDALQKLPGGSLIRLEQVRASVG